MSETKHTPGPWLTRVNEPGHFWNIEDEDGDCIASEGTLHGDQHPHMANAALIAAAPELLDVAELAHSLIVVVMRDHEGKLDRSSADFMAEKLDAAVRKAAGAQDTPEVIP